MKKEIRIIIQMKEKPKGQMADHIVFPVFKVEDLKALERRIDGYIKSALGLNEADNGARKTKTKAGFSLR